MSGLPPPPQDMDIYESRQPQVYASFFVTWAIAVVVVALRFKARKMAKMNYWWDDWIILVGLILATSTTFINYGFVLLGGVGKHIWAIPHTAADQNRLRTGVFAVELTWGTGLTFVKCSVLLFFWRIFGCARSARWAIGILFVLAVVWGISMIIVSCVQCFPAQAMFEQMNDEACQARFLRFYFGIMVSHILLDFLILSVPIPYVWSLNTTISRKIQITFLFCVGGFVFAVSIVRTIYLLNTDTAQLDVPWVMTNSTIWCVVEQNMIVVAACLPSMGPYIRFEGRKGEKTLPSSRIRSALWNNIRSHKISFDDTLGNTRLRNPSTPFHEKFGGQIRMQKPSRGSSITDARMQHDNYSDISFPRSRSWVDETSDEITVTHDVDITVCDRAV